MTSVRTAAMVEVKRSAWLHASGLGAVILVCYFGLWNAYFTLDDFWMLGWVRHRPTLLDALLAQFGYGVRFLLDANLWLRVKVFGLEPAGYYWISLAQHFGVALLAYALVRAWTGRRETALITGLLFATTPTHFEVVTWITGSNYSLAALPYLGALLGLTLYRAGRSAAWYWASVGLCLAALLVAELTLSLPLALLAYDFFLGRGRRPLRELNWRDALLHAPYWLLLAGYLALQVRNLQAGSSEAVVAGEAFRPGLHMLANLVNLAYLPLPPYGLSALQPWLGPAGAQAALMSLALAGAGLAALVAWRGSAVARFALAFTVLTFLPFTLWEGTFSAAIRYRYLPAIGFSLLVALGLVWLHDRWRGRPGWTWRWAVPALTIAVVVVNSVLVQVWVQRHLANSVVRRAAVTYLADNFAAAAPGTRVWLEVPTDKYTDVDEACALLFDRAVTCEAYAAGAPPLDWPPVEAGGPAYLLRVDAAGAVQGQRYPSAP